MNLQALALSLLLTTAPTAEARLSGPDARLAVTGDLLAGSARGGTYEVQVSPDRAVGHGPFGPIDVTIARAAQGYDVKGTWNGGNVDFEVTPTAVVGRVLRQVSEQDRGLETCTYDVEKQWHRTTYAGRETCAGSDRPVRFDVAPTPAGMLDERTAVLLVTYLVAPTAD